MSAYLQLVSKTRTFYVLMTLSQKNDIFAAAFVAFVGKLAKSLCKHKHGLFCAFAKPYQHILVG